MTSPADCDKAVILARGLGTRMRAADDAAQLSPDQERAADVGMKAMIPIGRPFLDYTISALADAGCRRVCLVIGPEHDDVRAYYEGLSPTRVALTFAIQPKPLGTADALLAARDFALQDFFLVVNSDNYYPVDALRRLRALPGAGLVAFARDALIRESNIDGARVAKYAVLEIATGGTLRRIVEKPPQLASGDQYISMNSWKFDAAIFTACERIEPSARGEYEIPAAVQYAIDHLGTRFHVATYSGGVLDLSHRADIPRVAALLRDVDVNL